MQIKCTFSFSLCPTLVIFISFGIDEWPDKDENVNDREWKGKWRSYRHCGKEKLKKLCLSNGILLRHLAPENGEILIIKKS